MAASKVIKAGVAIAIIMEWGYYANQQAFEQRHINMIKTDNIHGYIAIINICPPDLSYDEITHNNYWAEIWDILQKNTRKHYLMAY